jgi:hypothetical protein
MQALGTHSRKSRVLVIDRESPDYLRSAAGEWDIVVSASLPNDIYRLATWFKVKTEFGCDDDFVAEMRERFSDKTGSS